MPKTRRQKQAETDAKVMEAAFEGDMATLAALGRIDEAKRAQELTKCFSKFLEEHQGQGTTRKAKGKIEEMEAAGVNKNEALLLSWAQARDLRLGEPVWNLLATEDIHTTRGKVSLPKGARGTLMATNAAAPRGNPDPGRDFHPNRRMAVQFKLRNPVTKRIEPFNVAMYYKLLSHVEPYQDLYLAAESWCANWSRCHVHWSVLKLKLRCWAWVRRTRIRMGTHRVPAVDVNDFGLASLPVDVEDPVALTSELWDHSARLRMPFGPNDLLFTTFSAEYTMDHMLVPCRSLPADVDLVLRRWMYQRRVVVSRAHLVSTRNGGGCSWDLVLPVLQLWCEEDPEGDTGPFEPFYSAAPDGRFKSLEEFAAWWDEHARSMGAVEYGRVRKHGTRFNRRFTDVNCAGCLSNSYYEMDHAADGHRCPQFRLGELVEAVETRYVVLKVDLSLRV